MFVSANQRKNSSLAVFPQIPSIFVPSFLLPLCETKTKKTLIYLNSSVVTYFSFSLWLRLWLFSFLLPSGSCRFRFPSLLNISTRTHGYRGRGEIRSDRLRAKPSDTSSRKLRLRKKTKKKLIETLGKLDWSRPPLCTAPADWLRDKKSVLRPKRSDKRRRT